MNNAESFYRFFMKKGIVEAQQLVDKNPARPEYAKWFEAAVARSRMTVPVKDC